MESDMIKDMKYFYDLDFENKLCVDCSASMPKYISVNNAILLCQACAKRHKSLGFNISYIKEIESEWDLYLLTYINRGGNGRFIRLQREYKIDSMPIESKYITKAAEYYRLLIKSEVMAEPPPSIPMGNSGMEKREMTEVYFPEFENYQVYDLKENEIENNTYAITGYFDKFYNKIGKGFEVSKEYLNKQIAQNEIKDNVKNGSYQVYQAIKNAGCYLFQQSKPLVNYVSKQAQKGVEYLYDQLKENKVKEDNTTSKPNDVEDEFVEESNSSELEPIMESVNESKSNVGLFNNIDNYPITNSIQLTNMGSEGILMSQAINPSKTDLNNKQAQ